MLLLHTIHTTRTNSLKELITCKLLHLQIACNEHSTVTSYEVASAIILGPNCHQTRLMKEEEDLVHQNSDSSSTIVYVGSEWGNWVRQMIVVTQATPCFNMSVSLPIKMECY